MKIKLLILIGMTVVPFLAIGQSGTPVFFNKGKMSIVGTDPTKTVLYVAGDFVASRDASDGTVRSDIYLEGSKTVILGNFYQDAALDDLSGSDVLANVFSLPSDYFTGTNKSSKIEFRGTTPQLIGTRLTKFNLGASALKYSPAWKAANYIDFPEIVVVNNKHVTIAPEINASVKGVDLQKGRLVLDSRRMDASKDETTGIGDVQGVANSSMLAHLYVDTKNNLSPANAIKYNRTTGTTPDDYGAIDVKVELDPTSTAGATVDRSIVGMGSPYQEMKTDYFFWNFLMYPYGNNIFGYWNNTVTDPTSTIYAGQGFVVGIDLRGTNQNDYIPYQDSKYTAASFADRAKEGYRFGRFSYDNKNNYYPLTGMVNANASFTAQPTTHDAYSRENLNYTDVQRKLVAGFNYLANPFTAPLDVSDLLADYTGTGTGTATAWNVSMGEMTGDIYPYVWVLNPSSVAHSVDGFPIGMEKLYANYTYFLLKNAGGTYMSADANDDTRKYVSVEGAENIIAPLQMFLVYSHVEKPQATGIIIPASKRVLPSGANFLRSTNAKTPTQKWDDFIFEVADQTTKAYDRVAVVLRTADEIKNNASYIDVPKTISSVTESDEVTSGNLRTVTESGKVTNTVNSVLYTADSKGTALESKFIAIPKGATEVSTPLYLSPSNTKQNIVIKAKRLETKEQVQSIILKDKLTNKDFELSSGNDYPTTVSPTDSHDRFTLRFVFSPMGIEDEIDGNSDKTINSYYANGELIVSGFEDSDINSTISVYDIQGRILKQVRVNELTMRISEVFYPGAYIVKVVGNKSYVSKFIVR